MDMEMEKKAASSALQRSLSAVTYWSVPALLLSRLGFRSDDHPADKPRPCSWHAAAARAGTTCACARRTGTRRASWAAGTGARRGAGWWPSTPSTTRGSATPTSSAASTCARRLFVRRTRLLCRKCGATLGFGYDDRDRGADGSKSPRNDIRIRALQPLADADGGDGTAASPPAPSDGA